MAAALNDLTVGHHQNFMCRDNGGQTVRNDQGGFVLGNPPEFSLNGSFIGTVQCRCGLIKDQYRWVFQKRPGDRHTLLFSAGQFQAPLTHLCLIAQSGLCNEVMNVGTLCRLNDLLRGRLHLTVSDVVTNGVIEQDRVLGHDPDVTAKAGLFEFPHIHPVDLNVPTLHVIKAVQEPGKCRLARPRRANHRHSLARWNFKTEALQNLTAGVVRKMHIPKGDPRGG